MRWAHGLSREAQIALSSVPADQANQLALNLHTVGTENPRLIGRIGRLQRDGGAFAPEPLERGFLIVDQCNNDLAGIRRTRMSDDDSVTIEDARPRSWSRP